MDGKTKALNDAIPTTCGHGLAWKQHAAIAEDLDDLDERITALEATAKTHTHYVEYKVTGELQATDTTMQKAETDAPKTQTDMQWSAKNLTPISTDLGAVRDMNAAQAKMIASLSADNTALANINAELRAQLARVREAVKQT